MNRPRIHALSAVPMSQQKQRLAALGDLHYWDVSVGDPRVAELVRAGEIPVITPRVGLNIAPHIEGCRLIAVQSYRRGCVQPGDLRARAASRSATSPPFSTDAVARARLRTPASRRETLGEEASAVALGPASTQCAWPTSPWASKAPRSGCSAAGESRTPS
ncbi:MAG: hypothetical protein R2748_17445 [Bryobacterales bacterium]